MNIQDYAFPVVSAMLIFSIVYALVIIHKQNDEIEHLEHDLEVLHQETAEALIAVTPNRLGVDIGKDVAADYSDDIMALVNAVKAEPTKPDPKTCKCCQWPIRTNVKDIHAECWIEHLSDPDDDTRHSDTCTFEEE